MGVPAAKKGDQVVAQDTHIVMVPSPGGTVPTPLPHPFKGIIDGNVSQNVNIMGFPAAMTGSTASNQPLHVPQGGVSFQKQPSNRAIILTGSATVRINEKPAARNGDAALTCNDPADLPVGRVVAAGTVMMG